MRIVLRDVRIRSWGAGVQESDHRHRRLLRARGKRPRDGRAADKRDELASSHCLAHSITLSARSTRVAGTS
jgi:hypothetical protein